MSTNWTEHIRNGINNYQEEVLNFIKEEQYAVAAAQLVNVIYAINLGYNLGYRSMPLISAAATLDAYILRLIADLEFLIGRLLKKCDNREEFLDNIKFAMEAVELTIPLVELGIGIGSFLKKEATEE